MALSPDRSPRRRILDVMRTPLTIVTLVVFLVGVVVVGMSALGSGSGDESGLRAITVQVPEAGGAPGSVPIPTFSAVPAQPAPTAPFPEQVPAAEPAPAPAVEPGPAADPGPSSRDAGGYVAPPPYDAGDDSGDDDGGDDDGGDD